MNSIKAIGLLGAIIGALSTSAALMPHVPGELIVKIKKGNEKQFFSNKSINVDLKKEIQLSYGKLHIVSVNGADSDLEAEIKRLNSLDSVEYAEPNFTYSIVHPEVESFESSYVEGLNAPSDPKFSSLWGLQNNGRNGGTGSKSGVDIDALKAWQITKGSKAIKIAIIDTGIDYNHPDLKDNMWINETEANGTVGVDDDGNGYIDDIHGYDFANDDGDPLDGHSHGTHCAGTIGAVHNNGIGVAGVMADVSMVAIKFLSDKGSGKTTDAIESIDYATKIGVDLMSNSWGGGGFSKALKEAIENASKAGIIFTAAAGNSSTNNDQKPHYPSNYQVENVISVAAHNSQDKLASFSCYGNKTVHIAAPGRNILSTVLKGGYKSYSGTSMATPHVSGVLGLLLAQEGRMTHNALKERVLTTSVPVRSYSGKMVSGGRIQAYNLLTNTRPVRNEPKPEEWKTVTLPTAFESKHPYRSHDDFEETFTMAGAKFIRVVIDKFEFEKKYDYLEILSKNRNVVQKIINSGSSFEADYIRGDTMIIKFKSDQSVEKWGFKITRIQYQ